MSPDPNVATLIIVIIGGLNWGLVGVFNWDLFAIFGDGSAASLLAYIVVGLSALWQLYPLYNELSGQTVSQKM